MENIISDIIKGTYSSVDCGTKKKHPYLSLFIGYYLVWHVFSIILVGFLYLSSFFCHSELYNETENDACLEHSSNKFTDLITDKVGQYKIIQL